MPGRVQGPPRRPAPADQSPSWALFLFIFGCVLTLAVLLKPLCQLGIWALREVGVIGG